jgi:hypothetical protein
MELPSMKLALVVVSLFAIFAMAALAEAIHGWVIAAVRRGEYRLWTG